jgi:hypothetical protein
MAETQEHSAENRIERAEQLRHEAASYWQVALRGMFALPNATVLSISSAVLFVSGLAEQSFRRIEALSGRIGEEISRELKESRQASALPEAERARRHPTA